MFWRWTIGPRVGFYVLMIIIGGVLMGLGREIPGLNGESNVMDALEMFNITYWRDYLITFGIVAIVGPAVEEMVFRGRLTDVLMHKMGRW
jgi:membrane protease YdiL (CAAX protease family)